MGSATAVQLSGSSQGEGYPVEADVVTTSEGKGGGETTLQARRPISEDPTDKLDFSAAGRSAFVIRRRLFRVRIFKELESDRDV